MPSLPYHEPSLTNILTLSSFLLALNITDALLDRALYCGLVGQVLVGAAWGPPAAGGWLDPALQAAVVQLGFLGLALLVFGGGAATSVAAVARNLPLSAAVALTGVAAPMALSFAALRPTARATAVQCFAAGAALCSTSLGTTFAVLEASGLARTRLGTLLGTAAMMDDVLGLVMVQIVSSLGAAAGGGEGEVRIDVGEAVLRPVLVSLGFAVAVPAACRFVLRPVVLPWVKKVRARSRDGSEEGRSAWWRRGRNVLDSKHTAFVAQTALLIALVVGASFAGASVLLAAYLAGIVVSWWGETLRNDDDSSATERHAAESRGEETNVSQTSDPTTPAPIVDSNDASILSQAASRSECEREQESEYSGSGIYDTYYSQAVQRILKPFFFASIGFSIPVSDMFSGAVVWRGIVYGVLMAIGKILCGLWLVRFPISVSSMARTFASFISSRYRALFSRFRRQGKSSPLPPAKNEGPAEAVQLQPVTGSTSQVVENAPEDNGELPNPSQDTQQPVPHSDGRSGGTTTPAKPLSLYPAAMISSAMVARGEIGFLISAVAESKGIFRRPSDDAGAGASELFLIVTWAIVLCTIFGPICVGMLVRRLKKLEARAARARDGGTSNVLGVWGIS